MTSVRSRRFDSEVCPSRFARSLALRRPRPSTPPAPPPPIRFSSSSVLPHYRGPPPHAPPPEHRGPARVRPPVAPVRPRPGRRARQRQHAPPADGPPRHPGVADGNRGADWAHRCRGRRRTVADRTPRTARNAAAIRGAPAHRRRRRNRSHEAPAPPPVRVDLRAAVRFVFRSEFRSSGSPRDRVPRHVRHRQFRPVGFPLKFRSHVGRDRHVQPRLEPRRPAARPPARLSIRGPHRSANEPIMDRDCVSVVAAIPPPPSDTVCEDVCRPCGAVLRDEDPDP